MKPLSTVVTGLVALCMFMTMAVAADASDGHETVHVQFQQPISNIPGKSLSAVVVSYPPGAKSGAHHHAPSAFIYAYVVSGEIRSQIEGQPAKTYRAGESWFEAPGAHHIVSENASETEPAQLLAVIVADSGETALTIPDKH